MEGKDLGRLLSSPADVMRWHLSGRRERYAHEIANCISQLSYRSRASKMITVIVESRLLVVIGSLSLRWLFRPPTTR